MYLRSREAILKSWHSGVGIALGDPVGERVRLTNFHPVGVAHRADRREECCRVLADSGIEVAGGARGLENRLRVGPGHSAWQGVEDDRDDVRGVRFIGVQRDCLLDAPQLAPGVHHEIELHRVSGGNTPLLEPQCRATTTRLHPTDVERFVPNVGELEVSNQFLARRN